MSQQDAAKEQANTRKNVRIVSVFTAAAIGIVGVLVILYAWQLPPFTRHAQFTDNAYVRGQTTFISPQVNGYITDVNVQDFVQVKKGEVLFQIDDRIYRQRVHQAEAQLAMKIAALNNNLQQRRSDDRQKRRGAEKCPRPEPENAGRFKARERSDGRRFPFHSRARRGARQRGSGQRGYRSGQSDA